MLNFNFLEKGQRIVYAKHFVYFLCIVFLILFATNRKNVIVWLLLLREILGNMYIAIICSPVCYIINFKINFVFRSYHVVFLPDQKAKTKI